MSEKEYRECGRSIAAEITEAAEFAAGVEKWRRCVRLNLGYCAAFYWRRLLAMKGYRGDAVKSPWYYKVDDAGLIAFRCRRCHL